MKKPKTSLKRLRRSFWASGFSAPSAITIQMKFGASKTTMAWLPFGSLETAQRAHGADLAALKYSLPFRRREPQPQTTNGCGSQGPGRRRSTAPRDGHAVPIGGSRQQLTDHIPRTHILRSTNFANRHWAAAKLSKPVEPVDDSRATNPASMPKLLDALAADFRAASLRCQASPANHLHPAPAIGRPGLFISSARREARNVEQPPGPRRLRRRCRWPPGPG